MVNYTSSRPLLCLLIAALYFDVSTSYSYDRFARHHWHYLIQCLRQSTDEESANFLNKKDTKARIANPWNQYAVASAMTFSLLFPISDASHIPHAHAAPIDQSFENGKVLLSDPLLSFKSKDGNDNLELRNPQFLGSGGGGAVYAFERSNKDNLQRSSSDRVVVKVSWTRSAFSVKKECEVLEYLDQQNVQGVEQCLGVRPYPLDDRRIMIVMEPVVEDSTASISELQDDLKPHAVQCVVRTLVQMLAAGVVTTDVQPLISQSTGEVVFIDMTEARILPLRDDAKLSYLDAALSSSFCAEMLGLIPGEYADLASDALLSEMRILETNHMGLPRKELLEIILGQASFLKQDAVDFLER